MSAAASPSSTRPRSARRTRQLRLLLAVFGLCVASCTAELALHLAPRLLPAAFRERFPPHGIEFFDRGVLDRTPLTAVPLPYGVEPYAGPPPADLAGIGLATAADAQQDLADVPRLVIPADRDGLPNDPRPQAPDVVLVGDSFTLYAAQREPAGLQVTLEQQLGVRCLNLGIAGMGPDQELWLLEHVGLPAKPRVVVWFFFGGNDLIDAFWVRFYQGQGTTTYGDLHRDKRAPWLLLPNLIASWFQAPPRQAIEADPLPPVVVPAADGAPEQRFWLFPDSLRLCSVPAELLRDNPGLAGTRDVLQRAAVSCTSAGAKLLVVFLPCKEQLYLPHLAVDPVLLHRYAEPAALYGIPLPDDPAVFAALLQQNHGVVERAIADTCSAAGIDYWSATPALEAARRRGEPLYYRTDTHWRAEGQRAIVPGLIEQLIRLGVNSK